MLAPALRSLPGPRTSLIGREGELRAICELIVSGAERLVTLTGVGGGGKTRLALEAARRLREAFPDGVWLVELAELSNARLVAARVAAALALRKSSDHMLATALQARRLLLVLDNCEHLIDACASLSDQLLAGCPDLRILATSREPLLINGERQWRVLPLATPPAGMPESIEAVARYPAVQLFVVRAAAASPGFRLDVDNAAAIGRICGLVAGIPLAIELAAAQVRALSTGQIEARLDQSFQTRAGANRLAPTRHQTLRATLDWSYTLLSPFEQTAFRRLAVLSGNWSLEAAEAVCSASGLEVPQVLELLTRLVDKSLVVAEVQQREVRYHLLEPVRQYAAVRLAETDELDTTRARLAAFCIALAERAEPELQGPHQAEWLCRLDRELDNVRTVLGHAEDKDDSATILRLAGALNYFFWMRHHLREAHHWFTVGLKKAYPIAPELRSRGLYGLTLMLSLIGDNAQAGVVGDEALHQFRELGDLGSSTLLGVILAQTTLAQGDISRARRLADEAVGNGRSSGSRWRLAHALVLLGQVLLRQGELDRARSLHQEALELFEAHGDLWGRAYALASLESLGWSPPSVARVAALAGVRWNWDLGGRLSLAAAFEYLAVYGEAGNPAAQVQWCAAAYALRQSLGAPAPVGELEDVQRQLAFARAELGDTAFQSVWAESCATPVEQLVYAALNSSPPATPRPRGRGESLTAREREVACLLADGASDRQIAARLTITEGTAGLHVHHILAKLGLRSRVQVTHRAATDRFVDTLIRAPPKI